MKVKGSVIVWVWSSLLKSSTVPVPPRSGSISIQAQSGHQALRGLDFAFADATIGLGQMAKPQKQEFYPCHSRIDPGQAFLRSPAQPAGIESVAKGQPADRTDRPAGCEAQTGADQFADQIHPLRRPSACSSWIMGSACSDLVGGPILMAGGIP